MTMGSVLITGAAGFLGFRLVEMMQAREPAVTPLCLVNRSPWVSDQPREQQLGALGVSVTRVDICDPLSVASVIRNFDTVFHLASQTETVNPDQMATDQGTRILIDQLVTQGFTGTFVFASSLAVNDHRNDYSVPLTSADLASADTKVIRSVSRYGRAKLSAEQYLREQATRHGFKLRIVRFGTIFGAGPRANGLFDSVERLIAQNSLITRLNWPGKTALIHKDDACRMLMALAFDEDRRDCVSVFGVTQHLTLQQICQVISRDMRRPCKPVRLPGIFWRLVAMASTRTWRLEQWLPLSIYNFFWRTSLITHNTLWISESDVARYLDKDTVLRFEDHGHEVLQQTQIS